ncbi:unnamed protein product [Angiostrongylus costaricensis]|uniref:Antibiotic biosynthesis monooxygenase n=1 Tax=Angiostrongylus costaricensis TaxID=334426 RepID=A0A0R3PHY5_ANGCS|nr:unnamed protein product [Angiostrongylus costaricensis]
MKSFHAMECSGASIPGFCRELTRPSFKVLYSYFANPEARGEHTEHSWQVDAKKRLNMLDPKNMLLDVELF